MRRFQTHQITGFRHRRKAAQRGAALMVALILLIVITLVGLAAIGTTILQNKAAANQYDRQVAFQAAEAAMRQAEVAVQTAAATQLAPAGFEDCSTSSGSSAPVTVCLPDPFNDANVPAAQVSTVTKAVFNPGAISATQPQYVVQYLGKFVAPTPKVRQIGGPLPYGAGNQDQLVDYYRITARSGDPTKASGRSIVTLQSTFMN